MNTPISSKLSSAFDAWKQTIKTVVIAWVLWLLVSSSQWVEASEQVWEAGTITSWSTTIFRSQLWIDYSQYWKLGSVFAAWESEFLETIEGEIWEDREDSIMLWKLSLDDLLKFNIDVENLPWSLAEFFIEYTPKIVQLFDIKYWEWVWLIKNILLQKVKLEASRWELVWLRDINESLWRILGNFWK